MTRHLIQSALAPSTLQAYKRSLQSFATFAGKYGLPCSLPIPTENVSYFLTYLYHRGSPASSLASICSALAYFHKLHGFVNPCLDFSVSQILAAAKKCTPRADRRQPITASLLVDMLLTLKNKSLVTQPSLYCAMFSLAFHFGLRISEMTESNHNLHLRDISISADHLKISFRTYKHSPEYPNSHEVHASSVFSCPVRLLNEYLQLRGQSPGPLFLIAGKPVNKTLFSITLRNVLSACGVETARFSSHSFRIGAGTYWAQQGYSDTQIRLLGRWRSMAMVSYLRGTICHPVHP